MLLEETALMKRMEKIVFLIGIGTGVMFSALVILCLVVVMLINLSGPI